MADKLQLTYHLSSLRGSLKYNVAENDKSCARAISLAVIFKKVKLIMWNSPDAD